MLWLLQRHSPVDREKQKRKSKERGGGLHETLSRQTTSHTTVFPIQQLSSVRKNSVLKVAVSDLSIWPRRRNFQFTQFFLDFAVFGAQGNFTTITTQKFLCSPGCRCQLQKPIAEWKYNSNSSFARWPFSFGRSGALWVDASLLLSLILMKMHDGRRLRQLLLLPRIPHFFSSFYDENKCIKARPFFIKIKQ